MAPDFSETDSRQLAKRGIPLEEASRQLEMLRRPPSYARLVRPCVPGDGIDRIPEGAREELAALQERRAAGGRFRKFIPASGAATRMFRDLVFFHARGGPVDRLELRRLASSGSTQARTFLEFTGGIRNLAFYPALEQALAGRGRDLEQALSGGRFGEILDALLDDTGLALARSPKALLEFHRYADGPRAAVEEHLVLGADHLRDADNVCRLHFTVSDEHRAAIESRIARARRRYEKELSVRFDVELSVQRDSTDTLALDDRGQPFRDAEGRLLLRPGGHGALLGNLNEMEADLVYVQNIDNVPADHRKPLVARWKKILGGHLVSLREEALRHLGRLDEDPPSREAVAQAVAFLRERFHLGFPPRSDRWTDAAKRQLLRDRLDRPLRVCGMVRNTGEPGGGPFWTMERDGSVGLQIVESAQVDPASAEQRAILASSTHFNPVDMVCAVRDSRGLPFDLRRYQDPEAVIVARKSWSGRALVALERPGLWNGGMAGWNTVFVEVPAETFTPVKTVNDLLREAHQPRSTGCTPP